MTMDKTEKDLFPWDKISANTKRRITAELGMSKLHRLHEMDPFLLDLHANGRARHSYYPSVLHN